MAGPILPLVTFNSGLLAQNETVIFQLPAPTPKASWPSTTFLIDAVIPVSGATFTVELIYYQFPTAPVSPILYTVVASLTGITTAGLKRIPLAGVHAGNRAAPPMPTHVLIRRQSGGPAQRRVMSGICYGIFSGTGTKIQSVIGFSVSLDPATEIFFDTDFVTEGGWPALGSYVYIDSFSGPFTVNAYAKSVGGGDLLIASGNVISTGWTPLTPSVDFVDAPGAFPDITRIGLISGAGASAAGAFHWCRASE